MNLTWMNELYDTYENCKEFVGKEEDGTILLPVSFTWVNAQIECVLSEDASLMSAHVLSKEDAPTMIPCTIESANRTSKPVAHPLFDKLSYIAKELKCEDKGMFLYEDYRKKLFGWTQVEDAPICLKIVYDYLEKGNLIQDLTKRKILTVEDGILINRWKGDAKEKPELFKVLSGDQKAAVVRFCIYHSDTNKKEKIWLNPEVHSSFLTYYLPEITEQNLCMVSGKMAPVTELHSAYLRFPGDSAKLISSLDKLGFKYKGRNETSEEAVSVSYEVSQKAHNALKWLIQRQGFKQNGLVIVTWGTMKPDVINPMEGSYAIFDYQKMQVPQTFKSYAGKLNTALTGIYQDCFENIDQSIVVMSLDAATKGRLAILYHQTLNGSQFIERMKRWYETVVWTGVSYFPNDKEDEKNDQKKKKVYYVGTPSFRAIVNALYGTVDSDDLNKIKKDTYTTLLSCMIDGTRLPYHYITTLFDKFCRPHTFDNDGQRDDFLAIACALIRKYHNDLKEKEEWSVEIDYKQKQTYYLWGRLLGLAEWLERRANKFSDENRETNATRYRKEFAMYPASTWVMLMERLEPYKKKYRRANKNAELNYLEETMDEIMHVLESDLENNHALDDRFILGYGAQLHELRNRFEKYKNIGGKNDDNLN